MSTVSISMFVFEIGVWALLAATAARDFAAARNHGESSATWRIATKLIGLAVLGAVLAIVTNIESGDANPLIFEYLMLLMVGALVGLDARARGEWTWSARIHGSLAVLAVILALSGRYDVVAPIGFSDGTGAWVSATVVAALVLGVAPVVGYGFARGPRLDGSTPTVTFVRGVMGGSAEGVVMMLPRIIIAVVILAGILINGGNVIGRYVYLAPIIWAEEIMIYGMVWTVFIGAVLVTWDSRHLKMDLLSTTLPSPYKEVLGGAGVVMFLAVCVFVIPQNWTVFSLMYRLDQRSIVAEIPMSIPHFALLLGFVLMFLAVAVRFRRQVRGDIDSEIDYLVAGERGGSSDPASGE